VSDTATLSLDDGAVRALAVLPAGAITSLRLAGAGVEVQTSDGSATLVDCRGEPTAVRDSRHPGDRLWALVAPLHEERLGGTAVKWLYMLGGLAPAVLAVTGIAVWLTRPRLRPEARSDQTGHPSRRQPMSQNIHS
jgi:uncharacterized iron-regulated membrane protein